MERITNQLRTTLLATSAFLFLVGTGQAASIAYVRSAVSPDVFLAGASRSGVGSIDTWSGTAGTFSFELSNNGSDGNYFSLLTYCGDPYRHLSVGPYGGAGSAFSIVSLADFGYSARATNAIQLLYGNAYFESKTSDTKAAAFQFLLWEYIADSDYDLSAGVVKVTDTDVKSQVNTWNNDLSIWTMHANMFMLDGRAENKQSFFLRQTVQQVPESPAPEPATFALIGAGMLTLIYSRRKK